MYKTLATTALLALGAAMPAAAAVVTQSFTLDATADLEAQGSLFSSATAYAPGYDGGSTGGVSAGVAKGAAGWGVKIDGDNKEGGRIAGGETLEFSFDSAVQLLSVTFTLTDIDDNLFNVFVNGVSAFGSTLSPTTANEAISLDVSGLSLSGTSFGFQGLNNGAGKQGIRVQNFSVSGTVNSALQPTTTASVPLPATAPLLGGALVLGAAALRRRKKA